MAKKSIHTHVPTDLGVAILSIFVLLGVMFILIVFNTPQNTQTTQTHAATKKAVKPSMTCLWHNVCVQVKWTGNHYYCSRYAYKCT